MDDNQIFKSKRERRLSALGGGLSARGCPPYFVNIIINVAENP